MESLLGTNCDSGTDDCEIIVVGAGVVGLSIARRLKLLGHDVVVLERHARAGSETSSRNSEVIHAGLYYPPGSLRARLCVEGRRMLLAYCDATGVPVLATGKLIVACDGDEIAKLDMIETNARANGAPALRRLSGMEARAMEPNLSCVAALHSPGTAVIDSHQLLLALEGDVSNSGGTIVLQTCVTGIARTANGFKLNTQSGGVPGSIRCRRLVIAAGLGATALGDMLTCGGGYTVPRTYPAKAHYFALRGRAPFRHLIYPVPQGAWLGIHLTLNVAGEGRFGPDVEWGDDVDYSFDDGEGRRRAKFEREIRRYWPGLPDGALAPGSTGVRPKIYREGEPAADFAIHGPEHHGIAGLVALYGIESPGLTSCLAIGDAVAAMLNA